MTSELSKLLHEIKKCRDRDYSFEELCQTISSHSMDSFGSGRLSDEERTDRPNGTLTQVFKVRSSYSTRFFDSSANVNGSVRFKWQLSPSCKE